MLTHNVQQNARIAPAWPIWPLRALLVVLFFGPLIAPLFQATGLPLVADSGALAHELLSRYVCPTPAKSYLLFAFPMAVCARCWGATVGLWLAWVLIQAHSAVRVSPGYEGTTPQKKRMAWLGVLLFWRRGDANRRIGTLLAWYCALPWPVRLGLAGLPFLLWSLEITAWTGAPRELLLLNGAHAGFWAGLFLCSIWPGLRAERSRLA